MRPPCCVSFGSQAARKCSYGVKVPFLRFSPQVPEKSEDLWKWHNGAKGFLETRYTPHPTHWSVLQKEVCDPDRRLAPPFARDNPHFLLIFLLAAPHRLNPTTAMILERTDWLDGKWLLARQNRGAELRANRA